MIPLLTKFDPMAMVNPKTQADLEAIMAEVQSELEFLMGTWDHLNKPKPEQEPQ